MIFYLYKITNNFNNHYYIGRRAFKGNDPLKDPYMGSGTRIKAAIQKYGLENFKKEIVNIFNSEQDLINAEASFITEEMLSDPSCYNLAKGGKGGYTYYAERVFTHTIETKQKISSANKGRKRPDSRETLLRLGINKWWQGKTRCESDKQAKSVAAKKSVENGSHPSKKLVTCPHCNYTVSVANGKRWHFENCRRKTQCAQ
jgi:group I intron endonuclease